MPFPVLRRRSPAAAAPVLMLALLVLLALPAGARAAGSPDISATTSSQTVLFGAPATVTINASNPAGQPYGYNLSFRAVLPANVAYVGGSGSPAPTTVLTNQPAAGQTTLLWSNVSDLSPNSSNGVSFQVTHSTSAFTVGGSFAISGEASINTDPRNVTTWNATTGVPAPASFTGSGASTGTQSLTAIRVSKAGGGSLLRGVHDHQTTYTSTASNNLVNQTTGVALTDFLPAGIEYLGCGGAGADRTTDAPTNSGSTQEYPGSGAIVVPVVPGCVAPNSVDTVVTDPDGGGPLPTAVYTRLVWNIGTMAAGQVVNRPYRVAIPLRENTNSWTGVRPTAASGDQAANLDNNSGAETNDEQALTSSLAASGSYNGVTPVSDATTMTTIAEDLLVAKSRSSGSLVQTAITTWTLSFSSGEYRYPEDVTVTDTLPSGYCPLGPSNFTTGNSPSDVQCAPTGVDQPSAPYSSVTENANGTFTIVWSPAALAKLTHASVNDTWTITFPTRTRTNYQSAFNDAGPILAHDSTSNSVSLAGVALPRCTAPGAPDCSPTGPRIDHDAPLSRAVVDASSAGQSAPLPSIDKRIAQSGTNCATATYTNATPSYVPGDRICWLLRVDFPGGVDTSSPTVSDFLPPTVTFEPGSDTATPANTVGSTFDGSGAAQGALAWSVTSGGLVPKGSQVFQHTISSIVQPTGQLAPGQIPGNLMKFSASGTSGVSFPYRDQADFVLALPVLGVTKGVRQVNAGAVNGPNVDNVTVKGGDTVTYRVDVGNTGTADARDVVVWDLLPAEYDCATIGQITAISDAGTCVDALFPATQDRIVWTVPSLAQAATKSLTYRVGIPAGIGPARTLANRAGVRTFQTQSNVGTLFTYTPAGNIDATLTTTNVPRADDPSNVVTRNVTIAKAASSPVETPGNTSAQATIGENVTYTVTTVIPDGTSVPANFTIADAVSASRHTYQAGSLAVTLNGLALPATWSTSETSSTPTVTAPAAGYAATGGDTTIVMTFVARVSDVAANTRSSGNITNSATTTWTDPAIGPLTRTSTSTTIQVVEPLLTQTKTDDVNPGRALPGQIVTYTLGTTNSNAARVSIAHDTTISDLVPVGLTPIDVAPGNAPLADGAAVPGTGGAIWNQASRTITRTLGAVNPNTTVTLTYRVRVDNPAVAGSALTNTVTARTTSLNGTPTGERTSASATNTGYQSAPSDTIRIGGATVVKTADRATATVGDPVRYTADVTIPANINLFDVTLRDTLPDTLDYDGQVSASCISGCPPAIAVQAYTPTITGGVTNLAWDLGDITAAPADRVVRIVYDTHVRATHRTGGANVVSTDPPIVNSARVSTDRTNAKGFNAASIPTTFDDTSAVSSASVAIREPAITVNKQVSVSGGGFADSATAQSDDTFSYRIVVTNSGNAPAHDVQVTDRPDAELTGVTLAAGISTTASTDGWTAGDPAMAWTIPGPIAPGGSVTLTYGASLVAASGLRDAQTIVNTAAVPHYFGVPAATRALQPTWVYRDYVNGGSDAVTVTLDFPTLAIAKTTGRPGNPESANVEWGQSFPWRVVVTNTSATATAKAVKVHDLLPANWTYDAGSASFSPGGAIAPVVTPNAAGDDLDWTTGLDLAPGASTTLTFTATPSLQALLSAPGAGPNINRADASATDEAGNPGNADGPYRAGPDPATATLLAPALTIAKTPDAGTATAGSPTDWTIAVTNTGGGLAHDVTVTDVLPAGTTYTPGAATVAPGGGFSETSVTPGPGPGQTTVVWAIASIAAGATRTITVPVATDPALASGSTLTNSASASAQDAPTLVQDTGSRSVSTSADLQALKSGPATGVPGGPALTYTIGARNNGPSVARSVTLSDPLPAGATFITATGGCTQILGVVSCAVGDLAPGASFSADVEISYPASATGSRTNTVTAASPTPDPGPGPNTAQVTTDLAPSADVEITKTPSAPAVNNGEDITYTLVVKNNGPSDAAAVSVSDPLPPGTSFVSADPPCTESSATVTCALGTMAPGAQTTLQVRVTATSTGTKDNTATVTTTTPDSDSSNDERTATVTVNPAADLRATKTAPATADVGDTISYTIGAENLGPDDAAGVELRDVLPAGVQFVSADAPCTQAAGTVTCAIGALADGDSVTRDIRVRVLVSAAASTVRNTSTVDATTHDPVGSNDDASDDTDVSPDADLRLSKTAAPAAILRNGTTTFTLTATNDGPSTAIQAAVTDVLPLGLEFVSADAGCAEAPAGTITCDLGDLASGASASRQVVVKGVANGTWTNTAKVASDTHDRDAANDDASADVVVGPRADLSLSKTAPATVVAGGQVTWTLRVANQGPDDATGVTITDPLPAGVVFVSADSPCAEASGTVTCPVGTLPGGDSATVTITGRAPVALADRTLVNTATVDADQGDGDPADDSATSSTLVGPSADLAITKAGPATAVAGGALTWTVRVTNAGPSIATNVTVTDALPDGVSLVSATPDQGSCAAAAAITCTVGTLPIGASTQIAITARTTASAVGATVTNAASVAGDQPDPDTSNNTAIATATTLTQDVVSSSGGGVTPSGAPLARRASLTIRKTVSARRVVAGQRLIYWITATNTGSADAIDVRICDRLPVRLTYLKTTGARFIKGDACWTRARLAPGGSMTRRFEARVVRDVPGGVVITNAALVTAQNAAQRRAQVTVTTRGAVARRLAGVTG